MKLAKTLLLFLFGCIPARLLIALIAKLASKAWLRILGFIAVIPAIGLLYFAISGTRNKVGAFGEVVWWNLLRPIHALLYLVFAYEAVNGNRNAYLYLLADVLISLTSFIYVHSSNGDFSKAFL